MNTTHSSTVTISTRDLGRIGVLMGGISSEREVSLRSGQAVVDALLKSGCAVEPIDISTQDREEIMGLLRSKELGLAFVALHGKFGEDGAIQSILEELNIPYTGSASRVSEVTFNKVSTQRALRASGLPVADFFVAEASLVDLDAVMETLKEFPVVVKPSSEGSSFGVSVARSKDELPAALDHAFEFGPQAIIERFIDGRELTVGILDREALPIVEIRPHTQFFDYQSKYQKGLTDYIVPAQLSKEVADHVSQIALKAHQALGCECYSRVDIRLDKDDRPFILEINTIPGFTETSLFPKAARQAGVDFTNVCLRLIQLAYGKKK